MDKEAVWAAKNEELTKLGLIKHGHIICLKTFCMPNTNHKQVLNSIKQAGSSRTVKQKKKSTKTVHLGWLHYCKKKKKYVSVRGPKGGIRKLILPEETSGEELLAKATGLFFKHGRSIHGKMDSMFFRIGLYNGEPIDIRDLKSYVAENCLTKCRLYLMSKTKSFLDLVENVSSSDDDDVFVEPRPSLQIGPNTPRRNPPDPVVPKVVVSEPIQTEPVLHEQARPVPRPVPIQAEPILLDPHQPEQNLFDVILQQREERLPPEPTIFDDNVVLSVRTGNGTKRRLFDRNATMQQAYDWIGIIGDHIYFKLNHNRITILPDDLAANYAQVVLTMEPSLIDPFPVAILLEESVHESTFKLVNSFLRVRYLIKHSFSNFN